MGNGLRIERVRVRTLKPHPRNARKHDRRNIEAIAASLKTFGQRTPIVTWKSYVIKGNGTLEAAKSLGWKYIQIVRSDDLAESEAEAYALADNKTGDLSAFDFEMLTSVVRDLSEKDIDMTATGFSEFELQPLLDPKGAIEDFFGADVPDQDMKWRLSLLFENENTLARVKKGLQSIDKDPGIAVCKLLTRFDAPVLDVKHEPKPKLRRKLKRLKRR